MLVYLDGIGLPDEVYAQCDLATLEEKLISVIERARLGELDGSEAGPETTTVFMYGADAERLYAGIEATLRKCPLCKGARVVIKTGGLGAIEREILL